MGVEGATPANAADRTTREARVVFLVSGAATVALWATPFAGTIGWPLMLLSTVAHEMGHGLAAVLVGGRFESFRVWPDGSGVAMTAVADTALSRALVSAGGLVGPALIAMAFFVLGRRPAFARAAVVVLGIALLVIDVLLVRNLFGAAFIGALGVGFLAIAWKAPSLSQLALVFVAVQLALSVFSRGDYLFTDVAQTAGGTMPSDVAQMASALVLPYWVWGLACGAVSIVALLVGMATLLRARR